MQRIEDGDEEETFEELAMAKNHHLPREIISDVLARLPVKSLLRFRCVCRSWLSLISTDPYFVKSHLHRAISDGNFTGCRRVLLLTYPHFQSVDFEALNNDGDNNNPSSSSSCIVLDNLTRSFDPNREIHYAVAGSCNGLVCMIVDNDRVIVCNPCTRESRELPRPSIIAYNKDDDDPGLGGHGFGYDAILFYGFGYDSSIDDYKVVIAARPRYKPGDTKMEVFSLKSGNSWKRVYNIHPSISLDVGRGPFLDGSLHWIAYCREYDRTMVVSFTLATEELRVLVPLPPDHGHWCYLIVLGGCISVVCCFLRSKFEIWMMKQYGVEASWTKLFTYPIHRDYIVPLCLSKNGELLLNVDDRKLKMYNVEEMTCRDLDFEGPWKYGLATYIETLVSPSSNMEETDEEVSPALYTRLLEAQQPFWWLIGGHDGAESRPETLAMEVWNLMCSCWYFPMKKRIQVRRYDESR